MQNHSLCVSLSSSFLFFLFLVAALFPFQSFDFTAFTQYCFRGSSLPHFHFTRECAAFTSPFPNVSFCQGFLLMLVLCRVCSMSYPCFVKLLVVVIHDLIYSHSFSCGVVVESGALHKYPIPCPIFSLHLDTGSALDAAV